MANTTGKKFGGRQKGTPNKTTEEIREAFTLLVSDNLERLEEDLNDLEPEKRLKYIIELSKFVIPTLKATDITTGGELPQFIINLGNVAPNKDQTNLSNNAIQDK